MKTRIPCRRLIGAGAAAIMLGCVVACGFGGSGQKSGAVEAEPAGPPAEGEIVLPVDAYSISTAEMGKLGRARTLLIGQCLRRFGFPFDAADGATRTERAAENSLKDFGVYGNKRRYGITTLATAQRYGYHLQSTVDGTALPLPGKSDRDPHGFGELTPALTAVLYGKTEDGKRPPDIDGERVPAGGCMGAATERLADKGGPASFNESQLVSRIAGDSFKRSLNDPGVQATFAKWSSCMKAKGYDYPSPAVAGRDFNIEDRRVSPRELAGAKADVACKIEAKVLETWSGFEIDYQRKQIDKHFEELQAVRSRHEARMRYVAEIIAKG